MVAYSTGDPMRTFNARRNLDDAQAERSFRNRCSGWGRVRVVAVARRACVT